MRLSIWAASVVYMFIRILPVSDRENVYRAWDNDHSAFQEGMVTHAATRLYLHRALSLCLTYFPFIWKFFPFVLQGMLPNSPEI